MNCPRCSNPTEPSQRFCGQCGAALVDGVDLSVEVGQILDGKYQLTYLIGQGGMGSVYRAEVIGLGHTVAVKILHPGLSSDAVARRRLENEARLASQINHPNIVSIRDFHSSPSLTYLVMEYLMGESLREVLMQVGHLGVQRTIHIARQLLSALEASHAINVLHRDLKPDNIYLIARHDSLDFVKVLDFGMALHEECPPADRITSLGQVCGTPAYMSPEQVRGKELTVRSDLYAVGVILYECLTGVNPFVGSNTADTLVSQLTKTPELPSRARKSATVPPYLDAVVMQALRKTPADRFESATQFRDVLEALVLARRKGSAGSAAISACPACGQPLRAGESRCGACKEVLHRPGLAIEALPQVVPQSMIQTLDQTVSPEDEFSLSPTITSTSCPAIAWDPPLVGLARELKLVATFLSAPVERPGQHCLRIIGRAGAGKSRLAREAQRQAEALGMQCCWISAEHQPVMAPLQALAHAVGLLLRLPEGPLDEADLLSGAAQAGFDMRYRRGLLELLGLRHGTDPADLRRARRAEAWRQVVQCAATRGSLLLVFHDLGFLDGPTRELAAALASVDPRQVLVRALVTEEPDLLQLWPETATLSLPPLSAKDAVALAAMLLSQARVSSDPHRLAAASGGSPLMMLELVRFVADHPFVRLPRRLAEVINWRIGELPPQARTLLHAISVLGRPTSPEELMDMTGSPAADSASLTFLAEQGFLTMDERGWRPAHRVYREVAYSSIPVTVRAQLHLQAARVAKEHPLPPAHLAHHLDQGGEERAAVPYLLQAGMAALAALDEARAAQLFNRVLQLLPGPPASVEGSSRTWLAATLGLADALSDSGDPASGLHVLKAAAQRASDAGWIEEQRRLDSRREDLRARLLSRSGAHPSLEELSILAHGGSPEKDRS